MTSSQSPMTINLQLTSCMSPNADAMMRKICEYLTQYFSASSAFSSKIKFQFSFNDCQGDWMERARSLQEGKDNTVIGWICGFPYVLSRDGYTDGIYSCRSSDETKETGNENLTTTETKTTTTSQQNHNDNTINRYYSSSTPFKNSAQATQWRVLVAPIFGDENSRYQGEPIYFSDVIMKKNKNKNEKDQTVFPSFSSLLKPDANYHWGFNEEHSQSGYNLTRATIYDVVEKFNKQQKDKTCDEEKQQVNNDDNDVKIKNRFSKITQIGSHFLCVKAVIEGKVDAAAIDSIVLETEMRRNPDLNLKEELDIIDVLGPSPAPPILLNRRGLKNCLKSKILDVSDDFIDKFEQTLIEALTFGLLEKEENSRKFKKEICDAFSLHGFKKVTTETYDRVKEMLKKSLEMPAW